MNNGKSLFTIALAAALAIPAFAQDQRKVLQVQDVTPELSVYPCGDRHEALVVIRCSEPFILDFSSNVDQELKVDTVMEGLERQYRIVFETKREGTSFKGRRLAIIAPGFIRAYLPLELTDKEKMEYQVSDPYSKLRSLFYTATEKGVEHFNDGLYLAARDQFMIAKQCPEYETVENRIDEHIENCDSMLQWQKRVDSSSAANDYSQAKSVLERMVALNPKCEGLRTQYSTVSQEYNRQATYYMNLGEQYMFDEKYDLARECYEKVVKLNCTRSQQAALQIEQISLITYKFDNHTRVMFYQFSSDMPFGLTKASLRPDRNSGYFSMSINKGMVNLASDKLEYLESEPYALQLEGAASIGRNIRVYMPENRYIPHVWLMYSPFGYAIGGYRYVEYDQNMDETKSLKLIHAYAPEIGVVLKTWRVVLNMKYQYRYVLDKSSAANELMRGGRCSFGLGYCW